MKKILLLVAEEYEDMELHYPKYRLLEDGKEVVIAALSKETYFGKYGYPCKPNATFDEINPDDFAGVIIPGGFAPDKLRRNPQVLKLIQIFHAQKKLIAFICHAGWVPISAKVLKGITCTSFTSIKDDMVNAGVNFIDEPVVIDQHFISSRCPDDLPAFCKAILNYLNKN